MREYFEVAGILFCEAMIFYMTFKAVLSVLTFIWEKLK